MSKKRKTPRISPVSFYLGDKDERREYLSNLDKLARQLNVENRSQLLKKIAKGEIKLVREPA